MALIERSRSPEPITGVERSVEVSLGGLGGFEVRPTRAFVWRGPSRDGERLIPLADRPVGLRYERTERELRLGELGVRSVGNPLLTLAIAGTIAVRRWLDPEPGGTRPGPRS